MRLYFCMRLETHSLYKSMQDRQYTSREKKIKERLVSDLCDVQTLKHTAAAQRTGGKQANDRINCGEEEPTTR